MNIPDYKNRTGIVVVVLFVFSTLSACGIASRTAGPPGSGNTIVSGSGASHSLNNIQSQLYRAHEEWEGTPYILGGASRSGVDCSSFIQIVFNQYFDMNLPRNTQEQIRVGDGVRRNATRPGDLIFFRTSRSGLHVGIAVNGHEFLHASTSSGVMISSMNERYWASRFLGVRRVF
jgi:cell wall-associated NlpC family hydrolase